MQQSLKALARLWNWFTVQYPKCQSEVQCSYTPTARATTEAPQNGGTGQAWEAAANRNQGKGYGAAGHSLLTNITALIPEAVGYPVHYPVCFCFWKRMDEVG